MIWPRTCGCFCWEESTPVLLLSFAPDKSPSTEGFDIISRGAGARAYGRTGAASGWARKLRYWASFFCRSGQERTETNGFIFIFIFRPLSTPAHRSGVPPLWSWIFQWNIPFSCCCADNPQQTNNTTSSLGNAAYDTTRIIMAWCVSISGILQRREREGRRERQKQTERVRRIDDNIDCHLIIMYVCRFHILC